APRGVQGPVGASAAAGQGAMQSWAWNISPGGPPWLFRAVDDIAV
ncbi:MAG: hypothetical protein AVDCRST_MAG08-369, partial [uncultured Acetobacteraceae bacterium]